MGSNHFRCKFYEDPYTGKISEGVFEKDQFVKERFEEETYICVVNEQDSQFHWVIVSQDKKKAYFIDSLGRDFNPLWLQVQETCLRSIQKITMYRPNIMWSLSCFFWMQIGKRIRLEQHYGLLYMGLQIQWRVHLRLHQGKTVNNEGNTRRFSSTTSSSRITSIKTINSENNTRRFRNVEQFTRSMRGVQSSMIDNIWMI